MYKRESLQFSGMTVLCMLYIFCYDCVMHAMKIVWCCHLSLQISSDCFVQLGLLTSLNREKTFLSASGLSFWQNQAFVIVSRSSQNRHTQRKSQKNSQRFQKGMIVFQSNWVGSLLSHGFKSEAFVPAHHLPLYFDAMLLLM